MAAPLDFAQRLPGVRILHAIPCTQKGPDGPFCVQGMLHFRRNGMLSLNLAATGFPLTRAGSNSQSLA